MKKRQMRTQRHADFHQRAELTRRAPKLAQAFSAPEIALRFIDANQELFSLEDPRNELKVVEAITGKLGKQHVKFQQMYQGIKDLGGGEAISDLTSSNNSWNDAAAVSAHYNVGVVFEYYENVHGRKAIDGKGGTIYSIVHITEEGQSMGNAFWSGNVVARLQILCNHRYV